MPSFSTNYFFDDSTHSSVSMKRPNGANERRIYFKHSLQWRTAQPSPTRNRIISDIFGCDSSFCAKRLSENGLEWGAGKECWHRLTDKMNNPVNVRWQKIVTEFSSFHHQHISRRNRLNPFVCNLVEKRFIRNFNWKHLSAQITARSTEVFVTNKWNILLDFYGNVARWIWCAPHTQRQREAQSVPSHSKKTRSQQRHGRTRQTHSWIRCFLLFYQTQFILVLLMGWTGPGHWAGRDASKEKHVNRNFHRKNAIKHISCSDC